jgi:FkbM family methyltransferase
MIVGTEIEARWRVHACEKEPETVKWMEAYVRKGDIFYDVGANVGPYSLIAAHLGARVYAFEPESGNYGRLLQNIDANTNGNGGPDIIPLSVALWDKHELQIMHLGIPGPGGASHKFGVENLEETAFRAKGVQVTQPVLSVQMDDLFSWGLPMPNHIKIDVDGYENRVLAGASITIQSTEVRSVMCEIDHEDGHMVEEIMGSMRSAGLVEQENWSRSGTARNHLFVRV